MITEDLTEDRTGPEEYNYYKYRDFSITLNTNATPQALATKEKDQKDLTPFPHISMNPEELKREKNRIASELQSLQKQLERNVNSYADRQRKNNIVSDLELQLEMKRQRFSHKMQEMHLEREMTRTLENIRHAQYQLKQEQRLIKQQAKKMQFEGFQQTTESQKHSTKTAVVSAKPIHSAAKETEKEVLVSERHQTPTTEPKKSVNSQRVKKSHKVKSWFKLHCQKKK
ncbi:uncharacterized protein KNAG_0E00960 [Huiozyma naganishii CBS 8797]|uniref:Uncharacterized protein n=1 Tax=Huiozyma naganishii (strain ATCC MYA-139 / BCRC 22969 / CBS 8797 / KCTC 17520 / NBRC 10181 / NCYC 3082 / Yp74L-3) TaxID=1071383 RepID=J7S6G0_HUIN7|nr:hypothetical protein KNAG_0E00960 [Kazachstania naganishii CBS 8797]CCK70364.1 hypothetical protein KNAG_0E00960 [Kazachstania naganishii CBS 8797]